MHAESVILIGPVGAAWLERLNTCAPPEASVLSAPTRRELLATSPGRTVLAVVLLDADDDGIPTMPLWDELLRRNLARHIVVIHERAVIRLSTSWCFDASRVHHLTLGTTEPAQHVWQALVDLDRESGDGPGVTTPLAGIS